MDEQPPSPQLWHRSSDPSATAPRALRAVALSMLVARRAMRGTLPADFIHDAALEMLLALYLARPASMATDALADQTTVSPTVAQHWIAAMRGEDLVAVAGDMVSLAAAGLAAMETMLEAVVGSQRELLGWGGH